MTAAAPDDPAPLAVGATARLVRRLDDAAVRAFADLTGDHNPVHLDDVAAAASVFGGRVAHGMLVASLFSTLVAEQLPGPGSVYLEQTLRWRRPVRVGDEVVVTAEVTEIEAARRPGQGPRVRLATRAQVGDEVVLDGEARVLAPAAR